MQLWLGLPTGARVPAGAWTVMRTRLAKSAPDGTPLPVPDAPFDVLVEVRVPVAASAGDPAVVVAVDGALAAVPAVDRARSAVLAGVEHVVVAGDGPVRAVGLVRRRPGLDHPQFLEHWRERHVVFARRAAVGAGYRQLRADRAASEALASRLGIAPAGFDGAGMLFFPHEAAMAAVRATPAVRRDATADEMRFVDHSRSFFVAVSALRTA